MDENKEQGGAGGVGVVQDGLPKQDTDQTQTGFDDLHNASDLLVEYLTDEPDKPLPTGIDALDTAIGGGFRHKGLYILAGRTGEGKSSLALSIARRMALESKLGVLYLSLEMSKKELIERVICQATLTPLSKLEVMVQQGIAVEHIKLFQRDLAKAWFHIEDMKHADILSLDALWQEFKDEERKPDVLVIDHLQMVKMPANKHMSRADSMSEYMAELKKFCKAKNVIILVCCQINRDGKDKPTIANLKGCVGGNMLVGGHRIKDIVKQKKRTKIKCQDVKSGKIHYLKPSRYIVSGLKNCFEIRTASGKRVILSDETKVRTENGWKRVDSLSIGDKIVIEENANITKGETGCHSRRATHRGTKARKGLSFLGTKGRS